MVWRCPVCDITIEHSRFVHRPKLGVRYRCHICRLELVLNTATDWLEVEPLPDDDPRKPPTS
jgi:hypothetical protein